MKRMNYSNSLRKISLEVFEILILLYYTYYILFGCIAGKLLFSNGPDVSDATWTNTWSKDGPRGVRSAKLVNMYAFHDRMNYSEGMHPKTAFQFVCRRTIEIITQNWS